MTDLDTLVRSGLHRAAETVTTPDTQALADELRHSRLLGLDARRRRSHRALFAAAVAALVGIAAVAVVARRDDGAHVITSPPSTTTTSVPAGFGVLGPGWHDLDTGPVVPSTEHRLVWTDRELLVVASDGDTWRYRPDGRDWSRLASVPLPDAPAGEWYADGAVWTGQQVVAVFDNRAGARWSARWDPDAGRWTPIGVVPMAPALADAVAGTGLTPGSERPLLWSGQRVFDLSHFVSLDVDGGSWKALPLPDDLAQYTTLLSTSPIFDGSEVVFANVVGRGLAWDPAAGRYRVLEPAPESISGPPESTPLTGAGVVNGEIVFVSGAGTLSERGPGRAVALDAASGRWRRLPDPPDVAGTLGCPSAVAAVDDVVVVQRCNQPGTVALVDGRWVDNGPDGVTEALGTFSEAGGAMVAWSSSADSDDDQFLEAWVFVPVA